MRHVLLILLAFMTFSLDAKNASDTAHLDFFKHQKEIFSVDTIIYFDSAHLTEYIFPAKGSVTIENDQLTLDVDTIHSVFIITTTHTKGSATVYQLFNAKGIREVVVTNGGDVYFMQTNGDEMILPGKNGIRKNKQ